MPKIIAYLNPACPWARGVVDLLEKHQLEFEYRDIIGNPGDYREMVAKSGQDSSPCVEVDGKMLADVGSDEVETLLKERGLIE